MKKEVSLENGKIIEISVYYDLGSTEAWNKKERGYYYSVVPIEKESQEGIVVVKKKAYSGYRGFALGVKRKSIKAEELAIEKVLEMFPAEKLETMFP